MAALFFDSSALVKNYRQEIGSTWVRELIAPAAANELYVARICAAEVVAAIVRQQRAGNLPLNDATAAITTFQSDYARRFRLVALGVSVLQDAVRTIQVHGLRGYDGVQLASALQIHKARAAALLPALTFISADVELNAAATAEGLAVENPLLHP